MIEIRSSKGASGNQKVTMRNYSRTSFIITCDFERCVSAPGRPDVVLGLAPVDSSVLLLLVLHHPEEEQGARGEEHPMRVGARRARLDRLAVPEPADGRFGDSVSLAIQSQGFVLRNSHRGRVFSDVRRPELT